MAISSPFYAVCEGGLVLNANRFQLLVRPGVATQLINFEVDLDGGYRRINGYSKYGGESSQTPSGSNDPILGIFPYADGYVAVAGTGVYFTLDGIAWIQVNKDTTSSGLVIDDLNTADELPRNNFNRADLLLARGTIDNADNPFGVLYIATRGDRIASFKIEGVGVTRRYYYQEVPDPLPVGCDTIENHDGHLFAVDTENNFNTIHYSALNDFDSFTGTGSGSIVLPDQIVGIKSFRDNLIVFCRDSIHRLVEINDPSNTQMIPVTNKLGCLDKHTIQEINGDLIFLAPDGLRGVAATERLDDMELASVSKNIQPLLQRLTNNIGSFTLTSTVIRNKSQYRLYYTDGAGFSRGICGTFRVGSGGASGFEWSELRNIPAHTITTYFNIVGVEVGVFGDTSGNIYLHDVGNSFNGDPIEALCDMPDSHFGDLGMRKTVRYINISMTNEGPLELFTKISFDYNSSLIVQPQAFSITINTNASRWGEVRWGEFLYGFTQDPFYRWPIQGSGSTIAVSYRSNGIFNPFKINGHHIEFVPSGRK